MIFGLVFGLVLLIDQVSKRYVVEQGVATFNRGGIFGFLPSQVWVLIVVAVLMALASQWKRVSKWWQQLGLVLILAGGVSNLIDRFIHGGVVDFIYYPWLKVYGNIADIVLVVGVLVLIAGTVREDYGSKERNSSRG